MSRSNLTFLPETISSPSPSPSDIKVFSHKNLEQILQREDMQLYNKLLLVINNGNKFCT